MKEVIGTKIRKQEFNPDEIEQKYGFKSGKIDITLPEPENSGG